MIQSEKMESGTTEGIAGMDLGKEPVKLVSS